MTDWISTEDRMPEPYETVQVLTNSNAKTTGSWNGAGGWALEGNISPCQTITHWQPLPDELLRVQRAVETVADSIAGMANHIAEHVVAWVATLQAANITPTVAQLTRALLECGPYSPRRWRSVDVELPAVGVAVLVFADNSIRTLGVYWSDTGWKLSLGSGHTVTHWQPLPAPPTEKYT